jgi:hypothetical protein
MNQGFFIGRISNLVSGAGHFQTSLPVFMGLDWEICYWLPLKQRIIRILKKVD